VNDNVDEERFAILNRLRLIREADVELAKHGSSLRDIELKEVNQSLIRLKNRALHDLKMTVP